MTQKLERQEKLLAVLIANNAPENLKQIVENAFYAHRDITTEELLEIADFLTRKN